MKKLIPLFFIAAIAPAQADPMVGRVTVEDGDTWSYRINGEEISIRLAGIDAPELEQVCIRNENAWHAGQDAKVWLTKFMEGKTVQCQGIGARSYGRIVADCYIAGVSVQDVIVRNGWAYDFTYFSKGKYKAAEAAAAREGRGIWQGHCENPHEWRKRKYGK